MLKIGPPDDESLWDGLGLARTDDIDAAAFIAISGLDDPMGEAPTDYAPLLAAAQARGLDLLCANPDIVVRVGDRLVWCAGAVAREYEKIGGHVVMAGKPHAPIYDLAIAEIALQRPTPVARARILAIGDGVGTDVLGANRQNLDVLFIASGIHGDAFGAANEALDLTAVEAALAAESAQARFVMRSLC
jgi:ribonucleotide monophosphatase NagD (HAD superfamily)